MALCKSKDHSPIGTDRDCHQALQLTLQRVQAEPWKIHIVQGTGCIEPGEDIPQFDHMFRHEASRVVVLIEALQSLVAERLNHMKV
jgi:hypothetical protein